ncbi:hypothetical protein FNF31_07816 [Cafeteria roenbergensis]|uniref:WW domain-containing protein n=1 Tax=Cafeteria roenbergensis TaxID=33653 RepID=A0A5A8BZX5_CAFRO|nr:hypothetical protein FNF31_07816 [Cafeteria roenbergensis]
MLREGGRVTNGTVQEVCSALPGLTSLGLAGCVEVSDAGMWAIARESPGLSKLVLSGLPLLTHVGLRSVSLRCRQLTWLDLSRCPAVDDMGLRVVASGLWGLHTLHMRDCAAVHDGGVAELAQCCRRLTDVDVSRCPMLTDKALQAIARYCTEEGGLRRFAFASSRFCTDTGFAALAAASPLLEALNLSSCAKLSGGDGLAAFAASCPRLHTLALDGCEGISSAHIGAAVRQLPLLRNLFVGRCPGIRKQGYAAIARHGQALEVLRIGGTPSCDDDAVALMADTRPRPRASGADSARSGGPRAAADRGGACGDAERGNGSALHRLVDLDLSGSERLGKRGVLALVRSYHGLLSLRLDRCRRIKRAFVLRLAEELPLARPGERWFGLEPVPDAAERAAMIARRELEWTSADRLCRWWRGASAVLELRRRAAWRRGLAAVLALQARSRGGLARERMRSWAREAEELRHQGTAEVDSEKLTGTKQRYRADWLRTRLVEAMDGLQRELRRLEQEDEDAQAALTAVQRRVRACERVVGPTQEEAVRTVLLARRAAAKADRERRRAGASRVQALWRGHCVRAAVRRGGNTWAAVWDAAASRVVYFNVVTQRSRLTRPADFDVWGGAMPPEAAGAPARQEPATAATQTAAGDWGAAHGDGGSTAAEEGAAAGGRPADGTGEGETQGEGEDVAAAFGLLRCADAPGWFSGWDAESGAAYWWNSQTGDYRWEAPWAGGGAEDALASSFGEHGGERVVGRSVAGRRIGNSAWVEMYDAVSKAAYYFNEATEESAWSLPPGAVAESAASWAAPLGGGGEQGVGEHVASESAAPGSASASRPGSPAGGAQVGGEALPGAGSAAAEAAATDAHGDASALPAPEQAVAGRGPGELATAAGAALGPGAERERGPGSASFTWRSPSTVAPDGFGSEFASPVPPLLGLRLRQADRERVDFGPERGTMVRWVRDRLARSDWVAARRAAEQLIVRQRAVIQARHAESAAQMRLEADERLLREREAESMRCLEMLREDVDAH